jgi:hypothetical protein
MEHSPVAPAKLSDVVDVGGIASHDGLWHLACSQDDIVCARADTCLKFEAMVSQKLG